MRFVQFWCISVRALLLGRAASHLRCVQGWRRDASRNQGYPCAEMNGQTGELPVFALDTRLQEDTWLIGDFPLCRLLLSNDSNYPWFILVPRREGITELFQLDDADQQRMWAETTALARVLKESYGADKINVATLGNVVSQLHMHVIVRYRADVAWPGPVWGKHPAKPYAPAEVRAVRDRLASALDASFTISEG